VVAMWHLALAIGALRLGAGCAVDAPKRSSGHVDVERIGPAIGSVPRPNGLVVEASVDTSVAGRTCAPFGKPVAVRRERFCTHDSDPVPA
jgi:hypothetical protein